MIISNDGQTYVTGEEIAACFENWNRGNETLKRLLDIKSFHPKTCVLRRHSPLFERAMQKKVAGFIETNCVTVYTLKDFPVILGLFKRQDDPLLVSAKKLAQK